MVRDKAKHNLIRKEQWSDDRGGSRCYRI